jgi:4-hydroxybenzoate polyprenyltransferase
VTVIGATGRALVRAGHPEPGAAVTTVAVLLAIAWGAGPGTCLVVAVAAAAGQLTVGWCNDLVDRERDRRSGRRDKPLATGVLRPATVRMATAVAVVVTVAASLSLGVRPGLLHLALVATGWAYDLGLKRTVLSWLPYAICFGTLPVVVSLAARGEAGPVWPVVAGALLGTGAHLVNAAPDVEDDLRTGVRGLPQRLGAARSIDLATVLLVAGTVVAAAVPAGGPDAAAVVVLLLALVVLVAGRLAGERGPFRAALGIALLDVVVLLLRS